MKIKAAAVSVATNGNLTDLDLTTKGDFTGQELSARRTLKDR